MYERSCKLKKKKVFFIPYAGATSMIYYNWEKYFPENYEMVFIEPAGRGIRKNEKFYRNVDEAAEDIAQIIQSKIEDSDYYIFGHSMGALLAYEAYYKLLDKGEQLPSHIFFSGRGAAHIKHNRINVDKYDDDLFLKMVSLYGGLPEEYYGEIKRSNFLPVLRADFKMVDDYVYQAKEDKIECNISVLFGEKDFSVKQKDAEQWKLHAGKECNIYSFYGDHFFIKDAYSSVVDIIIKS